LIGTRHCILTAMLLRYDHEHTVNRFWAHVPVSRYPSGTKALRTLPLMVSQLDEPGTPQRKYGSFYTCSNTPSSSECSQNLVGYIRAYLRAATNLFHPVGNILSIKEESRAGVIQALWAYIKANNLQDKVDRKRIHADAMLRPVRVHFPVDGTLIRISSVDIWRRNDPIQSLARAGQSLSRAPKSSGDLLHSEPDCTTTGTASSLGYRA
jgi:hypothetical protein